jgi:hypothetical protein
MRSLPRCAACDGSVFWHDVKGTRVYYILPLLLLALDAARVVAQVELTITPAMTKGPPGAPVVIVEFSDYQ